jgi:hypothetical protein
MKIHVFETSFCLLDEVAPPRRFQHRPLRRPGQSHVATRPVHLYLAQQNHHGVAEQLVGVTMQEPGVSRQVAVDLEAAVAMLESRLTG